MGRPRRIGAVASELRSDIAAWKGGCGHDWPPHNTGKVKAMGDYLVPGRVYSIDKASVVCFGTSEGFAVDFPANFEVSVTPNGFRHVPILIATCA